MKLDYTIKSLQERQELVKKLLEEDPNPSPAYLEILADYLVFCMKKDEKKERKILTDNRLTTVNKRETSYEGLVTQFENGEDGIYNITADTKYILLDPKDSITEQDINDIPELQQTAQAIEYWEAQLKEATGRNAYIAKKALIEARKDQYVIKNSIKQPTTINQPTKSKFKIKLDSKITIDENGYPIGEGVTLLKPEVCSAILCNYHKLKNSSDGKFNSDL